MSNIVSGDIASLNLLLDCELFLQSSMTDIEAASSGSISYRIMPLDETQRFLMSCFALGIGAYCCLPISVASIEISSFDYTLS